MPIRKLDQAIKSHPFRPKGIKVGEQLYRSLYTAGRIKKIPIETMGRTLYESILDGDIYINIDDSSDDNDFELPTKG